MRAISNFDTGFPHMRGRVSHNAATLAELLGDAGYATFALGKWHLCPMTEASPAGPHDDWPLGRGFDRFYGFLQGETDQFHPELTHDNHPVDPPATSGPDGPEQDGGYHLSEDLTDRAIRFIRSRSRSGPTARSSPTWPGGPPTRPTRPRRPTSTSTGGPSTAAGTRPGPPGSSASWTWASCPRVRTWPPATGGSGPGRSCRPPSRPWRPASRRPSPPSSITPMPRSVAWSTSSTRSASSTTPC